MRQLFALVACVAVVCVSVACSSSQSPASPSAASVVEPTATGSAVAVGLSGVIRGLNPQARTFSLATRTDVRLVRADDQTEVSIAGAQARFGALKDGMTASVRGYDEGRTVLARTVSVSR